MYSTSVNVPLALRYFLRRMYISSKFIRNLLLCQVFTCETLS